MRKILISMVMLFVFSAFAFATGITFTFANGVVTGTSPSYYEFDVMAQAVDAGTEIGDNMVYINYNTAGFGSSIQANGKVTVTKGTLLAGEYAPTAPFYTIVNVFDNLASRLAITVEYNYGGSTAESNELLTSPTQLLHVKIEIADENQTAGLSFQPDLMTNEQYEYDNATQYSPVTASDTDNSALNGPSAIEPLSTNAIPDKFDLKPNFPNPFNPSTTLQFDVPEATANVELAVYDVLGKKVAVLFSGSVNPGSYKYLWNGRNDYGRALGTGVYFATFKSARYSKTIKMMLIK